MEPTNAEGLGVSPRFYYLVIMLAKAGSFQKKGPPLNAA